MFNNQAIARIHDHENTNIQLFFAPCGPVDCLLNDLLQRRGITIEHLFQTLADFHWRLTDIMPSAKLQPKGFPTHLLTRQFISHFAAATLSKIALALQPENSFCLSKPSSAFNRMVRALCVFAIPHCQTILSSRFLAALLTGDHTKRTTLSKD